MQESDEMYAQLQPEGIEKKLHLARRQHYRYVHDKSNLVQISFVDSLQSEKEYFDYMAWAVFRMSVIDILSHKWPLTQIFF